jgi:hypothetical protein
VKGGQRGRLFHCSKGALKKQQDVMAITALRIGSA